MHVHVHVHAYISLDQCRAQRIKDFVKLGTFHNRRAHGTNTGSTVEVACMYHTHVQCTTCDTVGLLFGQPLCLASRHPL